VSFIFLRSFFKKCCLSSSDAGIEDEKFYVDFMDRLQSHCMPAAHDRKSLLTTLRQAYKNQFILTFQGHSSGFRGDADATAAGKTVPCA
jgi:hypothetical protein